MRSSIRRWRRAADLRRSGADARNSGRDRTDPVRQARAGRTAARDDGGVLLDHQLPARPCRRDIRTFPDQAGGRGGFAGIFAGRDLRHAVAGAELRRLAQARARQCRLAGARRTRSPGACRARRSRIGGSDPQLAETVREPLLRAAAWYYLRARNGRGLPVDAVARFISAMARGSNGSIGWPIPRSGRSSSPMG